MMYENQADARAVFGALNTSGLAAWAIPGAFKFGGPSGNAPVAFNPQIVRPLLLGKLEPLTRGQVIMGGLVAPVTHGQAGVYLRIYSDALDAFNRGAAATGVPPISRAPYGFAEKVVAVIPQVGFSLTPEEIERVSADQASSSSPHVTRTKAAVVGALAVVLAIGAAFLRRR